MASVGKQVSQAVYVLKADAISDSLHLRSQGKGMSSASKRSMCHQTQLLSDHSP
jgi:hypothetical protein